MNWGSQINFFLQNETVLPMLTVAQNALPDPAAWPQAVAMIAQPGADTEAFMNELTAGDHSPVSP